MKTIDPSIYKNLNKHKKHEEYYTKAHDDPTA